MASHKLPVPSTTFVGRQSELKELSGLLAKSPCRLLSLVGPGGVGKTRLALELAQHTQASFADGVYFIPLQSLEQPEHVISAALDVLHVRADEGLEPKEALLNYLRDPHLLLIFDNFEHLLDAAEIIADILSDCPQVKVLVTSREPLNLHEEWLRELQGLAYPRDGSIARDMRYSGPELFAARARRLKSDFSLDAEYQHVVRICQLVDGLPLALELAAVWLRTLSCEAIAGELEHNVDLLTSNKRNISERHRSMRAVFDNSWRLLNDDERVVMRRFTVFRGGCTREAAEQVAGASLRLLAGLVEKSLLRHDPATARYDLQELLRQFAQEHLTEAGELELARELHHAYYVRLLESLDRKEQAYTMEQKHDIVAADYDNVRSAWNWAVEHQQATTFELMANPIWEYAASRAVCPQALELYEAARDMLARRNDDGNSSVLGQMQAYLGMCHVGLLHWERAEACCREALATAQEQGDPVQIGLVVIWLAMANWHQGKSSQAIQLATDYVSAYRDRSSPQRLGGILRHLGDYLGADGQIEARQQCHQESMELLRRSGDQRTLGDLLLSKGMWAIYRGQWQWAETYLQECEQLFRRCQHVKGALWQQTRYAQVLVATGRFEQAQPLLNSALVKARASELLGMVQNLSWALIAASLLSDARGDLEAASQLAQEALHYARRSGDILVIAPARFALGLSLISRGDDSQALEYLLDFLETALLWKAEGCLLYGLAAAARVLAFRGDKGRVAELLGLIFSHPNSPRGFLERYPPFEVLCADLEADLGQETFATAWARGAQFDVEQVADELRRELSGDRAQAIAQANQFLADPLTPRELEVLGLLAEGLTNAQIAERLFITIGTVKWHVNRVFQKLDVADRQQAVIHASELQLVKN